jgi:Saccharopine dehydrogenase NADP binding domain
MRIALLGGYGNAGRAIARLLRTHTAFDLLLLGRDAERAHDEARALRLVEASGSVSWATADARNPARLRELLTGWDVLVVASSTIPETGLAADAALAAGCDWLDLNLSAPAKREALRIRAGRIREAGLCFVTDGGVHPGLPGALVRHAAGRMPLRRAWVAARYDIDWATLRVSSATREEFLDELAASELRLLVGGRWVRGYRYARRFDFGAPLGSATCVPVFLPELLEVRDALPGLEELGFFVAGFGAVADWIVMPVAALGVRVAPKARTALAHFLGWGLSTFGSVGRGSAVVMEAEGSGGERTRLRLFHRDAYILTAAPVVATLRQWVDVRRPGLHTQAGFVDPERLIDDVAGLGVAVDEGAVSGHPSG